jgi:fructose-1-phosphate kinase PfkB-like protein
LRVNRTEAEQAGLLAAGVGIAAGAGVAVVSDGALPVVAWSAKGERWRADPPPVAVRNPIGCGDAMLAGLVLRLGEGADLETALRFGVALAAADAESETAGRPDPRRALALLPQVRLARDAP